MRTSILIVDDSATLRQMVKASLADLDGARLIEAASGLEALERLAIGLVNLVVLDLNMPDLSGIEVLRFMRAHERTASIPVIVLTTRGDEACREAVLAAGANLYVTKPFTPAALSGYVAKLLAADGAGHVH